MGNWLSSEVGTAGVKTYTLRIGKSFSKLFTFNSRTDALGVRAREIGTCEIAMRQSETSGMRIRRQNFISGC